MQNVMTYRSFIHYSDTASVCTIDTQPPTLNKKNHRGGETGRTNNLSSIGHKHPFIEIISAKRQADILDQRHQGRIIFNKE